MRRKWKSAFFACVVASSMIMGAVPTMVYADENVGSNAAGYVEESSGSQTSGDVSDVQRDNKQESFDTADTTDNNDSSNSGTVDSETKQETENTEGDSWQTEVPADESTEVPAEDETAETESTQADSDLAKAEETSWKDKLKEGAYISYSGHVQTYGDRPEVSDGQEFGTTGEGKRLEAFSIHKGSALENFTGDIVYRAHVQTYGTQDWKMNGEQIGTTGQGKRLEAIQMYLTGELAEYFDVYYCLHAQTFGWTKWVKGSSEDSGWCGTSGLSKRVEAVRICLVAKDGGMVPEDQHGAMVDYSYLTASSLASLSYSGHQQTYGDIGPAYEGAYLGVIGQSKRLEALSVTLTPGDLSGSVRYRTHVQTYGWQDWVSDGALSGTTGQSKRLEAIQIELQGDIASYYDIYYRVHIQTCGWLDWAKNGEIAGSAGLAKRLESIQIKLVLKGSQAPGSTEFSYVNNALVAQAIAWRGRNEADGSHKQIIDIYNSHRPLARNYTVQYTDSWCATFVSACAINVGITNIVPTECGCGQMVELFKQLGEWDENDARVPRVGDVIFYDWDDSGSGDNTGWPDHVGIVAKVSGSTITTIEGNKDDAVSTRVLQVNSRYIRGYGVPRY